ncbi:uncharacterized protein LOC124252964 [Haliotis rubra]|uniref:uncharacterized protein LOC124252964 n=1 Tax=Haliotis rubra TaxID=36100 RepID=UPI001EE5F320|nr:uncharacterized protein LOC124252964 [Haliotis rubra]
MPRHGRRHGLGHRSHFGHGGHFGHRSNFGHGGLFGHRSHIGHGNHFGHTSLFSHGNRTGHGRSNLSPAELLLLNQLNAPMNSTNMMMNTPSAFPVGNYYGILGTPGGARVMVSSAPGSDNSTPQSVGSSVGVWPQTPQGGHGVSQVGFEGMLNEPSAPYINAPPSYSDATVDYQVVSTAGTSGGVLKPLGMEGQEQSYSFITKGQADTDLFPKPQVNRPDPLEYIHAAPHNRYRSTLPRDEDSHSRGCCVIS